MSKNYFLFTMGRTGSSWICDLINSHPDIKCHYEFFKGKDELTSEEKYQSLSEILNKTESAQIVKILFYQVDLNFIKNLAEPEESEFLIVTRDPLDRYVSHHLAELTDLWHLDYMLDEENTKRGFRDLIQGKYSFQEIKDKVQGLVKSYLDKWTYKPEIIKVDIAKLKEQIFYEKDQIEKLSKLLNEQGKSLKIIKYEDLYQFEEAGDIAKRDEYLLDFFRLREHSLTSSRQKIDYMPASDRVSNYLEVLEALENI